MSIRRVDNGVVLEFQTVADLVAYEQAIKTAPATTGKQQMKTPPASQRKANNEGDEGRWVSACRLLQPSALRLLGLLHEAGNRGVVKDDVCRKLSVTGKGLGGVIGGIRKRLDADGFAMSDFIRQSGGVYVAGPRLLELGVS